MIRVFIVFSFQIIFHGNNLVNLHTAIHKEALPTELGGLKPPYNNFSFAKQVIGCNFQPRLCNDRMEHQQQQIDDVNLNRLVYHRYSKEIRIADHFVFPSWGQFYVQKITEKIKKRTAKLRHMLLFVSFWTGHRNCRFTPKFVSMVDRQSGDCYT